MGLFVRGTFENVCIKVRFINGLTYLLTYLSPKTSRPCRRPPPPLMVESSTAYEEQGRRDDDDALGYRPSSALLALTT